MHTVRQIERLWSARQFERLVRHLLAARPETSLRLEVELSKPVALAALALIRLDELNQSAHPLSRRLIDFVLNSQEADGGWGDPLISALCVRALLCSRGGGAAVDKGIAHLVDLQKADGLWPAVAVRRTASDAFTSAFILFYLADQVAFRRAARIDQAVEWFARNRDALDVETERLWTRAAVRCRLVRPGGVATVN
jgi:hypothetical protein